MQTRRQLLGQALFFPLAVRAQAEPDRLASLEIIAEPNCLSRESAEGFRTLGISEPSNLTVLCGISALDAALAARLREQVAAGRWAIWEMSPVRTEAQARILRTVFGIAMGDPIRHSPDRLYVRYRWPHPALIRSFSAAIPVACTPSEAIAFYRGTPVAMKRAIGRGGLVLLGSMLGPSLRAEDREARAMAVKLFRALG